MIVFLVDLGVDASKVGRLRRKQAIEIGREGQFICVVMPVFS